ncbi:MAG: hypothetical protein LKJ90_09225 [Faecalibacterium sp.]|jgi:hypothetical protein|nr:hypothetical protein [Faecalibacterium sp.]
MATSSYNDYTTDRVLGSSNTQYNAVFTTDGDNSQLSQTDFMKLLVTQMQNQDFTNPMDDSTMITEMAQFSNMQQMQQMANYMQTSFATGLVGKTATASRYNVSGNLETTTGTIDRVALSGKEYLFYINGKAFSLSELSSIQSAGSTSSGDTGTTSTLDPTAFSFGVESSNANSALLKWAAPTEDSDAAKQLKYTLYYGTSDKMDTVAEVEANGTIAGDAKQTNITQQEATSLTPGTTYYFNVVVQEPSGAKSVYKAVKLTTPVA